MNRRKLEQHLRNCGCILHHHGGLHDVWLNLRSQAQTSIPRHRELKRGTARGICSRLGVPHPPGL